MRTGEMAVEIIKQLDDANTSVYDNPSPHTVNVNIKKGPFIIISGHDLKDLEMLLKQTEGTGINILILLAILVVHGRTSKKNLTTYPDVS